MSKGETFDIGALSKKSGHTVTIQTIQSTFWVTIAEGAYVKDGYLYGISVTTNGKLPHEYRGNPHEVGIEVSLTEQEKFHFIKRGRIGSEYTSQPIRSTKLTRV